MPQEIQDMIYVFLVRDEMGTQPYLWIRPPLYRAGEKTTSPSKTNLALCNKELFLSLKKILRTQFPIAIHLRTDSPVFHDFERSLGGAKTSVLASIRKCVFVVRGAEYTRPGALARWALLSYNGALSATRDDAISYDLEESFTNRRHPCAADHREHIITLLKRVRQLGQNFDKAKQPATSSTTTTKRDVDSEMEELMEHLLSDYRLPSTKFCHGCEYTGRKFDHDRDSF